MRSKPSAGTVTGVTASNVKPDGPCAHLGRQGLNTNKVCWRMMRFDAARDAEEKRRSVVEPVGNSTSPRAWLSSRRAEQPTLKAAMDRSLNRRLVSHSVPFSIFALHSFHTSGSFILSFSFPGGSILASSEILNGSVQAKRPASAAMTEQDFFQARIKKLVRAFLAARCKISSAPPRAVSLPNLQQPTESDILPRLPRCLEGIPWKRPCAGSRR